MEIQIIKKYMKEINLEQWINEYKPIFIGDELKDFDLFREELKKYDNNFIWTEISCDDEEMYIITGLHIVNKFRIFITEIPWNDENIQVNDNEMISIGKAKYSCKDFIEDELGILFTNEMEDKLHNYYSQL